MRWITKALESPDNTAVASVPCGFQDVLGVAYPASVLIAPKDDSVWSSKLDPVEGS